MFDGAGLPAVLKGDGLMTNEPGVLLGIQTADCVPVLLADRKNRAVAAFHAGWRGTLARIVENGVGKMRLEFGSDPRHLVASIGPAIGQCCYGVGGGGAGSVRVPILRMLRRSFARSTSPIRLRKKYPMLFSQRPGAGA